MSQNVPVQRYSLAKIYPKWQKINFSATNFIVPHAKFPPPLNDWHAQKVFDIILWSLKTKQVNMERKTIHAQCTNTSLPGFVFCRLKMYQFLQNQWIINRRWSPLSASHGVILVYYKNTSISQQIHQMIDRCHHTSESSAILPPDVRRYLMSSAILPPDVRRYLMSSAILPPDVRRYLMSSAILPPDVRRYLMSSAILPPDVRRYLMSSAILPPDVRRYLMSSAILPPDVRRYLMSSAILPPDVRRYLMSSAILPPDVRWYLMSSAILPPDVRWYLMSSAILPPDVRWYLMSPECCHYWPL